MLGLERLRDDPRFATNAERVTHAEALREELEGVLATRPTGEWVDALEHAGVTCAPVRTLAEVLESEQARAIGLLGTLEHPKAGPVPTVRLPLRLSGAETTAPTPPPLLGADNALLPLPQRR